MGEPGLVLLSLAVGLVIGAGVTAMLHLGARRGAAAAELTRSALPEGVAELIDALDSPAMVVDTSNLVKKASAAARTRGLVAADAVTNPQLLALVDRVRRDGAPVSEDLELARGPFGEADLRLHVRVARLGARDIVVVAEDRTESHRLDQVRRDFIANVSHELKTPISAVGLLAEALQDAADAPEQVSRFAHQLTNEARRLDRITRDIIELSRLQATDTVARSELLTVRDVVTAAVDQNRTNAQAADVQLVVRGGKKLHVQGDEALLTAAVGNLLSNAIRHSPAGAAVGVGIRAIEGIVEIVVTDRGDGIPAEDVDRVFERFFRVDSGRSRDAGGSGLGLAIVKHAVQNHGGEVRVWSQPGEGSTFTIRLPEAQPTLQAQLVATGETQ